MSLDAPSSYRRQPRPLSVFVPLVHALRAMGMARSLRRAGHLMYLNAPSSVVSVNEVEIRGGVGAAIGQAA